MDAYEVLSPLPDCAAKQSPGDQREVVSGGDFISRISRKMGDSCSVVGVQPEESSMSLQKQERLRSVAEEWRQLLAAQYGESGVGQHRLSLTGDLRDEELTGVVSAYLARIAGSDQQTFVQQLDRWKTEGASERNVFLDQLARCCEEQAEETSSSGVQSQVSLVHKEVLPLKTWQVMVDRLYSKPQQFDRWLHIWLRGLLPEFCRAFFGEIIKREVASKTFDSVFRDNSAESKLVTTYQMLHLGVETKREAYRLLVEKVAGDADKALKRVYASEAASDKDIRKALNPSVKELLTFWKEVTGEVASEAKWLYGEFYRQAKEAYRNEADALNCVSYFLVNRLISAAIINSSRFGVEIPLEASQLRALAAVCQLLARTSDITKKTHGLSTMKAILRNLGLPIEE